jgi:hypothetical protein
MIYSSPNYALGADEAADQRQAEIALKQMQGGLKRWLYYRKRMDDYVAGKIKPPVLFRRAKPLPPAVVGATLRRDRLASEQDLAETLYALLTECGADGSSLPAPNVANDPDAAVKLAKIAIAGKTPSEATSAQAQGILWFVLAIPVAGVVLVISQYIKSKADVEKEKEHMRCIESGACTDSGFWLKVGAVAVVGWLAWDKFGLREAVERGKRKLKA